jgi:hypothetical protein
MMDKDPIKSLEQIELGIIGKAMKALNATNAKLQRKLINQHLSGPGENSLARRSGSLARSIRPEPAMPEGGTLISAKLYAGAIYAKSHFGPRGSSITIRPTKKQYLAIPLSAAKTAAGVARGGPLDGIWGKTFIAKGIIFGYSGGTKASRSAEPIPLFVLKKSVVIKRRIDPKMDMIQWAKPVFTEELKKAGLLKVG